MILKSKFLLFVTWCLFFISLGWSWKLKIIGKEASYPFFYEASFLSLLLITGMILIALYKNLKFSYKRNQIFFVLFFLIFCFLYILNFRGSCRIEAVLWSIFQEVTALLPWVLLSTIFAFKKSELIKAYLLFLVLVSLFCSFTAFLYSFDSFQFMDGTFVFLQNESYADRFHGVIGEPTNLGGLLALGLLASLVFILINFFINKMISLVMIALCGFFFLVLVGTYTKNALLSFVVALTVFLLVYFPIKIVFRFLVGFILCVLILSASFPEHFSFVMHSLRITKDVDSTNVRLAAWRNAFEIIRAFNFSEMIVGKGSNYFSSHFGSPFNSTLKFVVDHGVVGLVVFYSMFVWTLKKFVRSTSLDNKMLLAFISFSLMFSFSFDIFYSDFFSYISYNFWVSSYLLIKD